VARDGQVYPRQLALARDSPPRNFINFQGGLAILAGMSDTQSAHHSSSKRLADVRPESPAQLAGIGLILWIIGAVIHAASILVPIGLALLLVAGIGWLVRPRSHTMYWRGREIQLDDEPTTLGRLYRAIFRR
jgi:hypothetical protein